MAIQIIRFFTWYFFIGVFLVVPTVYCCQLNSPVHFLLYLTLWPVVFFYFMAKLLADPMLCHAGEIAVALIVLYLFRLWQGRDLQRFMNEFKKEG